METSTELEVSDTKIFGFWIYLMTDLVVFAVLFATFVTMRNNTFDGPTGRELFHLPFALEETLILLTSSFTCGMATVAVYQERKIWSLVWFFITFCLGSAFLYLEISEFSKFIGMGASWRRSGFLSSYFALVSTHGFHITIGLLWMAVSMFRIGFRGLATATVSRVLRLILFWHFLDIVWIFIFTIVYGMGHLL